MRATVGDILIDHSGSMDAELLTRTDYYPFGMIMPGRSYALDESHRYGFNGNETDDELKGEGNSVSFTFRVYDSRIGRFLSMDPLSQYYPYGSPFAFAENDVIRAIDLEGLEKFIVTFRSFIPQAKLENPNPFSSNEYFEGDNRMYYDVDATSFRTEQRVKVDFDEGTTARLNNTSSASVGLKGDGTVNETSEEEVAGTIMQTKGFGENSNAITFYFEIDAKNTLVSIAPYINADIAVTLTPKQDGSYDYQVKGIVDGFPAYELFVTELTEKSSKHNLIFNQNPIEADQGPWSLFGTGEFEYDYRGNSNSEQPGTKQAGKVGFDKVSNSPEKE